MFKAVTLDGPRGGMAQRNSPWIELFRQAGELCLSDFFLRAYEHSVGGVVIFCGDKLVGPDGIAVREDGGQVMFCARTKLSAMMIFA